MTLRQLSDGMVKVERTMLLGAEIGIDLGTANTVIINSKGKVLLNEPSVVAFDIVNGKQRVNSVGSVAKAMLGKTPNSMSVYAPLADGVIANFEAAEQMIATFLKLAIPSIRLLKPSVIVCVPFGATPVEKRAIQDCIIRAGARKVGLLSEPLAAALGAHLPIFEPKGTMIVDIGGGTTEIAVISLGSIVNAVSLKTGGNHFDSMIVQAVRKQMELNIGFAAVEKIKEDVLTASAEIPENNVGSTNISGLGTYTGLPTKTTVSSHHFKITTAALIDKIEEAIRVVLEQSPPDLASDIHEDGIFLTGGGSLLRNLDDELTRRLGIRVTIANDPKLSVAYGVALAFLERKKLMPSIEYQI